MRGIEFGDRSIHVVDVEPHLQRDPTLLIDAEYTQEFVARRPRAGVCGAYSCSGESQPLASYGDDVHADATDLESAAGIPFIGREVCRREADDLSATLDLEVGCPQLFGFIQGLAIDCSHRPFGYSRALVVQLDLRRFGRRRSDKHHSP